MLCHFLCAGMDLGPILVDEGLLFGSSRPPPGTLGFLRGPWHLLQGPLSTCHQVEAKQEEEVSWGSGCDSLFHWLEMEPGVPEAHAQHPQRSLLLLVFRGGKGGRECQIVTQGDGGTKCLLQSLSLRAFALSSSSPALKSLSLLLTSHPLRGPLSKEKQNKKR